MPAQENRPGRGASKKPQTKPESDGNESGDEDDNGLPPVPHCERCGAEMQICVGPYGHFWGCSNYPECASTKQIPTYLKNRLAAEARERTRKPYVTAQDVEEAYFNFIRGQELDEVEELMRFLEERERQFIDRMARAKHALQSGEWKSQLRNSFRPEA